MTTVATPYGLLFPKIWGSQTPPKISIAIISRTGKATNFKFCKLRMHIHDPRIDRNKSPLKISGKVAVVETQGLSKIFRALICRAHRAIIFAIAQLSCFTADDCYVLFVVVMLFSEQRVDLRRFQRCNFRLGIVLHSILDIIMYLSCLLDSVERILFIVACTYCIHAFLVHVQHYCFQHLRPRYNCT